MYAVVACSSCRQPWLIELRHATVSCPACGKRADVARRARLWQGESAREGQAATATLRERLAAAPGAQTVPLPAAPLVRHDDPLDAAAAQARKVRNLGRRAEIVADWLTRLVGDTPHDELVDAMLRAGLDAQRAEKEIVRMLACDIVFEPRAGCYRTLE